ncbi:hypothetical protein L1987_60773 [Smallanthus sonchifolius]|uniref:Uncharacterized protein n=1 Tax=Smallanthus sonchifolius TaxID=185202 RepID=A0ACB9D981_9ASTR|nr:hypothetical protein L1987_60773 [Smallanthus sonchifolius]
MIEGGSSKGKMKAATVLPPKKKFVSTMMVEYVVGSVTKVAKNMKNKKKINPEEHGSGITVAAFAFVVDPSPFIAKNHCNQQGLYVRLYTGRVPHISANDVCECKCPGTYTKLSLLLLDNLHSLLIWLDVS